MKIKRVRHMALVTDYPKDLPEKLTLHTTKMNDEENIVTAYKKERDGLWIPRALVPYPPENAGWEKVEIAFNGKLKDYQEEVVSKWLKQKKGIIAMGTGLGKTVVALYLAHKIGLKTLIIVPGVKLFYQWIQRVKEFCGFYPTTIRGEHMDLSTPIVIGMLQTLALGKRIDREKLYKVFGFTIYDEVHHLGAEKFNIVAGMFWDKYRLGLSATPKRKDGMHRLFYWHIGKPVAVYYGHQIFPSVYMIRYIDWDCSAGKFYKRNGDLILPRFLNHLCNLPARNILIALYAYYGYTSGRRILILSDRLDQLNKVACLLKRMNIYDYSFLIGSTKNIDGQIILGTYGCAGEGFDLPELDYLILATPRADIRQAVGRVLRPKDRTPIVIDIVDNTVEVMRRYAFKRLNFYKGLRAKIKEIILNKEKVYDLFKEVLERVLEKK